MTIHRNCDGYSRRDCLKLGLGALVGGALNLAIDRLRWNLTLRHAWFPDREDPMSGGHAPFPKWEERVSPRHATIPEWQDRVSSGHAPFPILF